MLKTGIIISSIRPNRFADKPAEWILGLARQRPELDVELLDLRDYPMPLFAEEGSPAFAPTKNEVAQRWQAKIDSLDAFIFVVAEYNRSITGALKNAMDYAYPQWVKKPAGFVGYGSVGGARAIEHLRLITVELQMAPMRSGVHISGADFMAAWQGGKPISDMPHLEPSAKDMLDQLIWWGRALKTARAAG